MVPNIDRRASPPSFKTTGAAGELIGTTEPKLADTVRRGRVSPEPTIVAGRRLWTHQQVLQAAEVLGLLNADLRERIDAAFGITPTSTPNQASTGGTTP
ncbi:MAG TPA: hypothetical protein VFD82_03245 [Planctomycetota bacterium]|nr:hypothetical protein [Planctomycetota bacterium]